MTLTLSGEPGYTPARCVAVWAEMSEARDLCAFPCSLLGHQTGDPARLRVGGRPAGRNRQAKALRREIFGGHGGQVLTDYVNEVWRLRHFWLALVRNDLRNRYRRSMIGLGWSLLQPISMTIIFCVVFSALFQQEIRTFAPYLLSGLVFWGFVAGSVNQGCQCFFMGESYIRQHRAPLAIHALRIVLGAGVHFLLGMGVVLVLVAVVGGLKNPVALLSLLPALVLMLLLGWSLAVVLGVVNVLFQDTQHLVEVGLQMLFYLTPIMYPAELMRKRSLGWFIDFNPLAALLELIRSPLLSGQIPPPLAMGVASVTVLALAVAAVLLLCWAERRIIMYL